MCDLLGPTIQNILERDQRADGTVTRRRNSIFDSRNGYKPNNYGELPIKVPQDRNSGFEPKVVPKHKRDISEIEGKIISMHAGMSTRQISDQIQDIYGFDVAWLQASLEWLTWRTTSLIVPTSALSLQRFVHLIFFPTTGMYTTCR